MKRGKARRAAVPSYVRRTLLAIIVLAGLLYPFIRSDSGIVGSNGVRPVAFVTDLGVSRELCEELGTASRSPTAVQLTVGTNGAPQPLRFRVQAQSGSVIMRGYRDGLLRIKLPSRITGNGAVLCIQNRGRRTVSLAGESRDGTVQDSKSRRSAVSLILLAQRRSWSSQSRTVFKRIGFARAGLTGTLVVWTMVALLLTTIGGTVAAMWRWVG